MADVPVVHSVEAAKSASFVRELTLFDSIMVVAGVMIGSGIFIVPAEMARVIGSPGGLLAAWVLTGVLTVSAALSYGELASMMPEAGGMYIYLREAFSPAVGFLYGWTLFTVIQTGTIAAVAVAFARFSGILWPSISETHYLLGPIRFSAHYAVSLSTAQLAAFAVIAVLTWTNSRGLRYGKLVQNVSTVAKISALAALIVIGLSIGLHQAVIAENLRNFWSNGQNSSATKVSGVFGLLIAVCIAQSGSLFSADSWHNVTFAGAEVKNPRRTLPLALGIGCALVIALYLLTNVAYLVSLPFAAVQQAPGDRVATAMMDSIFPGRGAVVMAIAIIVSTFGCLNSLILAGPRVFYAMARDGLFFPAAAKLNRHHVPGRSLLFQGVWAAVLVLPRTFDPETGAYGNLYSNLLDYVISAALLFYILTIFGVIRLRRLRPHAERPFRVPGYPLLPVLYVSGAAMVFLCLLVYRPATTWPGIAIVLAGVPVYGWAMLRRRRS